MQKEKSRMGKLGKLYVSPSEWVRGVNGVIRVDFVEEMTFEEALVRGKGDSHLDSRQGEHPCKDSKVEIGLALCKKSQQTSVLEQNDSRITQIF